MCGITGFVGQGNKEILKRMTRSLSHRGPDDEGFFIQKNVGLGHRRLSIIDLTTGHQPVYNEDKTVVTICNGEIYNFKDLRKRLEEKGHKFYTQSDTEVIVHLYEEKGENFLEELNGMFAITLWDEKEKKLILARDRLGKKPLYYSLFSQTLIFGSELKAILVHPKVKKEIDFFSLAKYLNYEYIPSPQTIFKGIYKLGPGEFLVYQKGEVEKKKYWDIKFNSNLKSQISKLKEDELLEGLDRHLERSVKMRLIADVPLGVWLSGGIDSTTITYYAQKNSIKPVKTFSIGFTEPSFDESKYIRKAVNFFKTEHYEKIFTSKDCQDLILGIIEFLDEPLADASVIPTYLLSKFTREKVKVALGGDGGDELFMGYPTFQAHRLATTYKILPSFLRKNLVEPIINHLPTSFRNISFDFKLKRFISGFEEKPEIRDQIWMGSFHPKEFQKLFLPEICQQIQSKNIFENIENYLTKVAQEPLENRLIYLYLKNYLQEDILVKTDRTSMAVGLEVRAPLLDYQLVEFVNSIPSKLKLKGLTTKYLFKKLMEDKIPKECVYRPKKGFGIPIGKWIQNELKIFVLDLFNPTKIKREGIFNFSYINRLFGEHFSGKKDHRKLLWTLILFEIWLEKWGK